MFVRIASSPPSSACLPCKKKVVSRAAKLVCFTEVDLLKIRKCCCCYTSCIATSARTTAVARSSANFTTTHINVSMFLCKIAKTSIKYFSF